MVALDTRLAPVIGDKSAKLLESALGLRTVGELLWHAPRRYATRGERTDLTALDDGAFVTVMAEVQQVTTRTMRTRRGTILDVVVGDGRASLHLTFFNQQWRERLFQPGRKGLFGGRVSTFNGRRQLTHPECVLLPEGGDAVDAEAVEAFAHELIPIYPATAKLPTWRIAKTIRYVLDLLDHVDDLVPDEVRAEHSLPTMDAALRLLHVPATPADARAAAQRLAWEEAFLLLAVMRSRREHLAAEAARPCIPAGVLGARFDASLPFALTDGQREIGDRIAADLAGPRPMHRLLQGEVGSGKTLVALRAMLAAVDAGAQCALLAPTEVLAQQHLLTMRALLGPLGRRSELDGDPEGTDVVLLTGSVGAAQRRDVLARIADGSAGIVIGTHALLEDRVRFADLALVVVDEQHRFGVEQRATIRAKAPDGTVPHMLVMTATSIPRTAAITVFGDLEVSTLRELPAGRAPITTHAVAAAERPRHAARMWERVREEVTAGHQAYVVCPRIEAAAGDDADAPAAAEQTATALRDGELAGLRVGLVHGRMPADAKAETMRAFAAGRLDVLVATTVIEVGIDVPNASTMIVLDADHFGISQLHQLRGRIGRGGVPGLCLLHTRQPSGSPASERLARVADTTDGFALAQLDLEQRGEGDVLGTLQSGGRTSLRLLSVLRDQQVIEQAALAVDAIFTVDPTLNAHPALAQAIAVREFELQDEYLDTA